MHAALGRIRSPRARAPGLALPPRAGILDALARFIASLQRYATSLGAAGNYHETITYSFIFLIHERMVRRHAATFEEFASANADLFGPILDRYYPTLASDLARGTFVMPDRCARRLRDGRQF